MVTTASWFPALAQATPDSGDPGVQAGVIVERMIIDIYADGQTKMERIVFKRAAPLRPPRPPSPTQQVRWTTLLAKCEAIGLVLPMPPLAGATWPRFPDGVGDLADQLGKARSSVVEDLKKALIWRATLAGNASDGTFR